MQTWSAWRLGVALRVGFVVLVMGVTAGCPLPPYRLGGWQRNEQDAGLIAGESQIERGRPAPVVDTVGWVMGVPAKICLLDYRVLNHHVSSETEMSLQDYLNDNGLDKVKVRINQYDPCGEWDRLRRNRSVCWPVRYTVGTLSVIGYTLLPGRIFGGEGYNPYTNSIYVYSDVAPLGLYAAGHAKEYALQEHKTLYALCDSLPALNIGPERRAAKEALDYLAVAAPPEELREGYRAICPACALRCSLPLQTATGLPFALPSLVVGHAVGQVKAAQVHEDPGLPESRDAASPEPRPEASKSGTVGRADAEFRRS